MSKQSEIKKEDWKEFIKDWHNIKHPISPTGYGLELYKELVKKHVKGKKALILGSTWQFRDFLSELGFKITCIDISKQMLESHTQMCKTNNRNEKLIVGDWLEHKFDEKFDVILGDGANFQLKEENYDQFFNNISKWLSDDGKAILLIEAHYTDESSSIEQVAEFIKNATEEELDDYDKKAYYYLGYFWHKFEDEYGDVIAIQYDIQPLLNEEEKKKFDRFSMHLKHFKTSSLPGERVDEYIKNNLEIVETVLYGKTITTDSFYRIKVLGKKND